MAVQRRMGILPERRTRAHSADCDYFSASRPPQRPANLTGWTRTRAGSAPGSAAPAVLGWDRKLPSVIGSDALIPVRPGQFDGPNRPAVVEFAALFEECGDFSGGDPHLFVRRLLADDRRDHAGHSRDVDVNHIVQLFSF